VFEKTGVNRQADLVKLVAGYMNPLAATDGELPPGRRQTTVGLAVVQPIR